jgi:hypothetical protein
MANNRGPVERDSQKSQPLQVRAWVAEQLHCRPEELREMRALAIAPGVRELRYLRDGRSPVVVTVARQQPGRYRMRATCAGVTIDASVRGSLLA